MLFELILKASMPGRDPACKGKDRRPARSPLSDIMLDWLDGAMGRCCPLCSLRLERPPNKSALLSSYCMSGSGSTASLGDPREARPSPGDNVLMLLRRLLVRGKRSGEVDCPRFCDLLLSTSASFFAIIYWEKGGSLRGVSHEIYK